MFPRLGLASRVDLMLWMENQKHHTFLQGSIQQDIARSRIEIEQVGMLILNLCVRLNPDHDATSNTLLLVKLHLN